MRLVICVSWDSINKAHVDEYLKIKKKKCVGQRKYDITADCGPLGEARCIAGKCEYVKNKNEIKTTH